MGELADDVKEILMSNGLLQGMAHAVGLGQAAGCISPQAGNQQAMAGQAAAYRPADIIAAHRRHLASKDKVLEYFEAQLNMDLFKGDVLATQIFNAALNAAFEKVKNAT